MTRQRLSAPEQQSQSQREFVVREKFDYATLDADVAQQVKTAAHRIRLMVKKTLEDSIAVGRELLAIKDALPPGQFALWLHAEFGWAGRTARNFMNVAERFGPKTATIAYLNIPPTAAYLLAAPTVPEELCETAIARAEKGERITVSVARELIDSFKKPPLPHEKEGSEELATRKVMGELIGLLESLRRRWPQAELYQLARELRDYADFLEQSNRRA